MKIGDLVKVPDCPTPKLGKCPCFFCFHEASRVGVVTGDFVEEKELVWTVHFANVGQWEILESDFTNGNAEILYEDR